MPPTARPSTAHVDVRFYTFSLVVEEERVWQEEKRLFSPQEIPPFRPETGQ